MVLTKLIEKALLGSATLIGLTLLSQPAQAVSNFAGPYAPANWTFTNTNADGSVNTSNAPNSITITGGNNGSNSAGTTDYTINAAAAGTVSFNWNYSTEDSSAGFDPFGYLLDGAFTQLTNNSIGSQTGTASFSVTSGQVFGFRVRTTDNGFGRASATISNFNAPVPVPLESDALPVVGSALFMAGGIWWKKKRAQAKVADFIAKK